QHEISRQIQVQFNNVKRTLTKIDKSITGLISRTVPKSKPSVKVDKKKSNKVKNLKRKGSRKK
ncbi:MAG: hypothetical protein WB975_14680, partial [Nitrososphaeraceae archaeon]